MEQGFLLILLLYLAWQQAETTFWQQLMKGIFYSSNNGTNWFPSNSPNQYTPGISTGSDHFVYSAVPGIGIYKSADDGINWVPSLQSPTVDYVEVAAVDNFAFAGAFFGGARFSSNYGGTWAVSNGFPNDGSVFRT